MDGMTKFKYNVSLHLENNDIQTINDQYFSKKLFVWVLLIFNLSEFNTKMIF